MNDRTILMILGIIIMIVSIVLAIVIIHEGIEIWPMALAIIALFGGAYVAFEGSKTKIDKR